jgi:hypothetical protein
VVAREHLGLADVAAARLLPDLPPPARLGVARPDRIASVEAAAPRDGGTVDWRELAGDTASEAAFRTAVGSLGAASAFGGAGPAGMVLAAPFVAVSVLAAGIGVLEMAAADIRQSGAQAGWGECANRIGEALSADALVPRLRAALPADTLPPGAQPAARRRGAGEPPTTIGNWRVSVERTEFRRCGRAEPVQFGVDVASRWTASAPGRSEPGYDATIVMQAAGGFEDERRQARRPRPWETVLPATLPCRPLASYCAAGGAAALTQDVVDAVAAAQDAIAKAR